MPHRFFSFIRHHIFRFRHASLHRDVALVRRVHGRSLPTWPQMRHMTVLMSAFERRLFFGSMVLGAVSLAWLSFAIIRHYQTEVPAVGGAYVEAIVGSPRLLNPIYAPINDTDMDITRLLFRGLLRLTASEALVPDIAERLEESTDKKQYTFFLRSDAIWHDGEPVTARDVVFTFETIQNSESNSPLFVTFQGIRVEEIDERTVRFHLPEPFAPFLSTLTVGILPEHVWGGIPAAQMSLASQNSAPIGNGPFQFHRFVKSETGAIRRYELLRFDRFYGGAPYLKSVAFSFYPSYTEPQANPIEALREHQVDGIGFVPRDLVERVDRKDIQLHTLHLPQYTALFFNQSRATILEDKMVRSALRLAVDKERIVRESLHGEGRPIHGPILPGFPGYVETASSPHDLAEANRLLDEAGWSRLSFAEFREEQRTGLIAAWKKEQSAATGKKEEEIEMPEDVQKQIEDNLSSSLNDAQTFFRKKKDGTVLKLTIATSNIPELRHAAELVAGFWQEIGVETKVEAVDSKELSRQTIKKRAYDVLLYGVLIGADPDQFPFWHSSQKDAPGLNLSGYVNRKADDILQKMRETNDAAGMATFSQELDSLLREDIPAIFLYTPTYTYATHKKVKGIEIDRVAHPSDRFADIEHWYIKTDYQWK